MIGIIDAIKSETIAGGNFIFAAPLSGRLENIAKHCRAFGGYIFVPDAPESIHRLAVTCAECFVFLRFIGAIENRNGLDKRGLIDGGSEPADNLGFVACSRRYRQIALDRDGLGVFRKRHAVLLYHGGAAVKVMAERRLGQIGLEAQGRHRQMLHQLQLAVFVLAVADYRGGIKARHFDMVGRLSAVLGDIPYHLFIPA